MSNPNVLNLETFKAALDIVADAYRRAGFEPRLAADHISTRQTAELWIYGAIDEPEFYRRCAFLYELHPELRASR